MIRRLTTALALSTIAGIACAQEVRLADGRVLVGPTARVTDGLRIATRDGDVTVPHDDVVRIRERTELRAELRRLEQVHGDAAHAALELARVARRWGLEADMWRHLDACVEACPADGAVRRRLDQLLADLEPELLPAHLRDASASTKVRELLRRARPGEPARRAAIEHVLAALEDGEPALRSQARRGSPPARLTAIRALGRRDESGADRFVYRSAILDSSADVRAAAMQTDVAQQNAPLVVRYLAPGLVSRESEVCVRTAEAFANLGELAAVERLVAAGPATLAAAAQLPGGSTRGYVAVVDQTSYIRDFDVEVAQAAFIADPVVDVLQSGVVLDVTVHSVQTVRTRVIPAYRRALVELAGSDPGNDPSRWPHWYGSVREMLDAESDAAETNGGSR